MLRPLPTVCALLLLAFPSALLAAPATDPLGGIETLRAGRYRCAVSGVLCNACTRAIVEEVLKVPGIRAAKFDFEEGWLWLSVEQAATVKVSRLRKALGKAARKTKLGARYDFTGIEHVPGPSAIPGSAGAKPSGQLR